VESCPLGQLRISDDVMPEFLKVVRGRAASTSLRIMDGGVFFAEVLGDLMVPVWFAGQLLVIFV